MNDKVNILSFISIALIVFMTKTYANTYPLLSEIRKDMLIPSYSIEQKEIVWKQAFTLMNGMYVHKKHKFKLFGVDPVTDLLKLQNNMHALSDEEFHFQMHQIFNQMRDTSHTKYYSPAPLSCYASYLSLSFEKVFIHNKTKFAINWIEKDFIKDIPQLKEIKKGDILVSFDKLAPEDKIREQINFEPGPNPSNELRKAMQNLTYRPHKWFPIPQKDSITLKLKRQNGELYSVNIPWKVVINHECVNSNAHESKPHLDEGVNEYAQEYYNLTSHLESKSIVKSNSSRDLSNLQIVEDTIVQYKVLNNGKHNFGYIQFANFQVSPNYYLPITIETLLYNQLSDTSGLIIDLRNNFGGIITLGESMLKMFSNNMVETLNAQALVSSENTSFVSKVSANGTLDFWDWYKLLVVAELDGHDFSYFGKITSLIDANSTQRVYRGPIIVLVNSGCYSTCEMFAAGIQDNQLGEVWGTDPNTGGAGANVIYHHEFYGWTKDDMAYHELTGEPLFYNLPKQQNMKIPWRRVVRTGKNKGMLIESTGVFPDKVVPYTHHDLLNNDERLIGQIMKALSKKIKLKSND